MRIFYYQHEQLYAEKVALADIATRFGTPCYVYSRAGLEQAWQTFDTAFADISHRVCFAVKANTNLAVLNILARLGSGFDIVSLGELEKVLRAGGKPENIVFSGVGKLAFEIERALSIGIGCFNVESSAELDLIHTIAAKKNKKAPIAIRVNPNVDAQTHPHITTGLHSNKFGVAMDEAIELYQRAQHLPHLKIGGVAFHIGSQITSLEPFSEAINEVSRFIDILQNHQIQLTHIDIGGGLGVRYRDETPPHPNEYATLVIKALKKHGLKIIIEPGRAIAANSGVLLTQVAFLKHTASRNFAIVDAGMNDLMRPALYDSWHEILPVKSKLATDAKNYDIVGPVCESADYLGKDRNLPITEGSLLAVMNAGAYGFCLSSNYNSRPRIAEVMVSGDQAYLVRRRETIDDLCALENILPD